jgi:predicted Zn-dependent peptidase
MNDLVLPVNDQPVGRSSALCFNHPARRVSLNTFHGAMREEIQETRFDNGLVVLTDRMLGVRSATLGFFFRAGSRHEPAELNGISHFIEHTVFKGTATRSALDIAVEQDRLGGNLDAFTTHEETGFAIKVIDDQLPRAFDLIADMLTNPRFDPKDLKSEQQVIIEEMKMIEDAPEEYLGDIFSTAFFPDHPLGMSIAGTKETVRLFSPEVTSGYHRRVFNPRNLVISAAGNIDHDAVVQLAADRFNTSTAAGNGAGKLVEAPPKIAAPFVIKQKRGLEQAHLVIATPLVSATDERRYAADLLANIIGGGTSSRLWQKIREEHGLAYSVGASSISYQDCGLFSFFAACSPTHVREVVSLTIKELRDVVQYGFTDDELDLARQQSIASILMSLEDSASRAASLAQSEIVHGRIIPVEETLERINSVVLDDLSNIARTYFRTSDIAFAALGDLKKLDLDRDDLAI